MKDLVQFGGKYENTTTDLKNDKDEFIGTERNLEAEASYKNENTGHQISAAMKQTETKNLDGTTNESSEYSINHKYEKDGVATELGTYLKEKDGHYVFEVDSAFKKTFGDISLDMKSKLASNGAGDIKVSFAGKEYKIKGSVDWDQSTVTVDKKTFDKLLEAERDEKDGVYYQHNNKFGFDAGFTIKNFDFLTKQKFDQYKNQYSSEYEIGVKNKWESMSAFDIIGGKLSKASFANLIYFDKGSFNKIALEAYYDLKAKGGSKLEFAGMVDYSISRLRLEHGLSINFLEKQLNGMNFRNSFLFPLNKYGITSVAPYLALNYGFEKYQGDMPGYQHSIMVGTGLEMGDMRAAVNLSYITGPGKGYAVVSLDLVKNIKWRKSQKKSSLLFYDGAP